MSKKSNQQPDGPTVPGDSAGNEPSPGDFGMAPEADTFVILQQLEELKSKALKADENWEKYLRVVADFDNYKKRVAREMQDSAKFANQSLLERLVPVLDNFDAALAAVNGTGTSLDSLKTGITMIHSQLKSVLTDAGLEEIDAANQPFNPNLHEAVSQQETADVPEGQVVQQLRKGYKLRERLVRPATVVVARKPAA